MDSIIIDGDSLTLGDVARYARALPSAPIGAEIAPAALERMARSRAVVDACVRDRLVRYGITTGFGKFCDVVISPQENELLQRNLIMSHACGVGEPFPAEVVRAMALLRANALAVGYSGARPSTARALLGMVEAGVIPLIPEQGSLGASGDLAPLSHMVLVLIGQGEAVYRGERMPGARALREAGLEPVVLGAKEGLALINGTQAMTALGALAAHDARELLLLADAAAALTAQALLGIVDAYDPRVHELRRQGGQIEAAASLRSLLEGSRLTTRQGEERVQDAYALRCAPQVHGASRDAIGYVASVVERELNAVTDNPIIFPAEGGAEADIVSGGNFHGQPIALAMDFLGIALSELADLSERRTERLVNPALSNGLPAFLAPNGGLNSGFMIAQYVAAAVVSENKVLAHPASVDSIPSSANQEDHVSMGTIAARKARTILENLRKVLAIELLAACQAIDLRLAARSRRAAAGAPGPAGAAGSEAGRDAAAAAALSPRTYAAYRVVRSAAPFVAEDRVMYPDIEAVRRAVADGSVYRAVAAR